MTMKLADACFNVATFTACDGVSMRIDFMHDDAAMIGDASPDYATSIHLGPTSRTIGGIYDFTNNYHLLFSFGRGLQHAKETNEFSCNYPPPFSARRSGRGS